MIRKRTCCPAAVVPSRSPFRIAYTSPMMIPTTAPFSIERPADANPAIAPARAGTEKKITRSMGWKFDTGFSEAKTTRSVPERIPTRIARSRCWNLDAVTEIDCSIESDSKIVGFLSVAFVENQNAKRHKFTEKSILQHSIFPFPSILPTAV